MKKDEYEKSGKTYTKRELDTMRGGQNEVQGSRDAARIQEKLRQQKRKDKRDKR